MENKSNTEMAKQSAAENDDDFINLLALTQTRILYDETYIQ